MIRFSVLIFGICIFPLYFTNYGVRIVDRTLIEYLFLFLGILSLYTNILKNKIHFFVFFQISMIIYIEYLFNPFLIHNYAPESVVASISGITGNYGLVLFSLSALLSLIAIDFECISQRYIFRMKKCIIVVYFSYLFLIFYSIDRTSVEDLLGQSYGVNIHTYYLTGLATLIFIFSILNGSISSVGAILFFLLNASLNIFVFKTRGTLCINTLLLMFSFYKYTGFFRTFFTHKLLAKMLFLCSLFIFYIYLFMIANSISFMEDSYDLTGSIGGIFGKELSGKRNIILQEWIDYTLDIYSGFNPTPPEFTPHNSFLANPAIFGLIYTIVFTSLILYTILVLLVNRTEPIILLIINGFLILFSTAQISLQTEFYLLVLFAMLFKMSFQHRTKSPERELRIIE